jgi:nicotinamidase-related amidase
MTTAVLVIDVQQGLCEGDGAAFDCAGTIERINQVTAKARFVDATVIFVQHESTDGYLAVNSAAWQLANGLNVQESDLRIRKTTPDSFLKTDLHSVLLARKITKIVICGMHTEYCVDTTTRRALALGFAVVLISDAHTSAGNEAITAAQVIAHHNATLTTISSFGPKAVAVSAGELSVEA